MVPDVAGSGHSFKGALAYYLHDKRPDETKRHPETSERVAWTETRNLATDDMRTAERIMIATAKAADLLKREAGIKATGRKSNAHVYAYSLAWHPDEAKGLTKAEMLRAADASLKALGAADRQAVIVCHTDRDHPHVHVILNRVSPTDGRMLELSNDRLKLSDWANAYERERGTIYTPKREKKRELRVQHPAREKRQDYARQKFIEAKERAHERQSQVEHLKQLGAAQRKAHDEQWKSLAADNKAARDQIYDEARAEIQKAIAKHKTDTKPKWRAHFKAAKSAERTWNRREKTLSGRAVNSVKAAKHQKQTGQLGGSGMVKAVTKNFISNKRRDRAFDEMQDMTRKQLDAELKRQLDNDVAKVKDARAVKLKRQQSKLDKTRADLAGRQQSERDKLGAAWKQLPRQAPTNDPRKKPPGYGLQPSQSQPSRQPEGFFDRMARLQSKPNAGARPENFFERKARLEKEAEAHKPPQRFQEKQVWRENTGPAAEERDKQKGIMKPPESEHGPKHKPEKPTHERER